MALTDVEKSKITEEEQHRAKVRQRAKGKQYTIGCLVLLGIVIVLVALIGSGGDSKKDGKTQSPAPTAAERLRVGEEGILRVEGQEQVLVATSKENLDKVVKALVAKDTEGLAQMVLAGEAFLVDSGTKVRVIDTALGVRQVRIFDGGTLGRTGWVPMEFVVK